MKRLMCSLLLVGGIATSSWGVSLSYTFSDKDFLNGASWGTMTMEATATNTVQVTYEAAGSTIPSSAVVTRFGFGFDRDLVSGITNYSDTPYLTLDWLVDDSNNLQFPGVANGDEFDPAITKDMFFFGAVDDVNAASSGVGYGQADRFDIVFSGVTGLTLLDAVAFNNFLDPVGIRLQSLPNNINGGSLFLAGRLDDGGDDDEYPVPEPGTLLLLGTGLLGLAGAGRRRLL